MFAKDLLLNLLMSYTVTSLVIELTLYLSVQFNSVYTVYKGVRQGCILSPCLFNLHAEYIMRNAGLEEAQVEIKIAGRNINNLRYPDDTTLMADSEEELHHEKHQSTSWETLGWMKHKLESSLPGEITITSDMQMTSHLWHKAKKNKRASWWRWKRRVKKLA